jgi:hypothetical protein
MLLCKNHSVDPTDLNNETRWHAAVVLAQTLPDVRQALLDLDGQGLRAPYSFAQVKEAWKTEQVMQWDIPTKSPGKWAILIRQSYNQVDYPIVPETSSPQPGNAAKPALFSYTQNQLKSTETWTAQGAVMTPISVFSDTREHNEAYLAQILLVPSVSFNKITGNGATQKADSLTFRLGSDFDFANFKMPAIISKDRNLFTQFLRLNFTHATDFEFKSQLGGAKSNGSLL